MKKSWVVEKRETVSLSTLWWLSFAGIKFADHLIFEILFISRGFNYAGIQYVNPLKVLRIEHLKRNVYVGVGLKNMKINYTNIYDDKTWNPYF